MEIGDTAEHGHEVYPSDVPSLGYPNGIPGMASGAGQRERADRRSVTKRRSWVGERIRPLPAPRR